MSTLKKTPTPKEGQVWVHPILKSQVKIVKILENFVFYEGDLIKPNFKTVKSFTNRYRLQ